MSHSDGKSLSGGRVEIEIDWKKVDELLIAGCTGVEVASYMGFHHDTLYDRVEKKYGVPFSVYLAQKRSKGDSMLRAVQFQKAMNKDNMMLIWLGKNRLKQKDKENDETDQQMLELKKKFDDFMGYLSALQSPLSIDDNSNKTDNKS